MSKQPPILTYSELTGCVYIVTSYKVEGEKIIAREKHDVTEQFKLIVEQLGLI